MIGGDMDRDYDVLDNRCKFCDVPLISSPSEDVEGKGRGKKGLPPHQESDVETLYYISD